MSLTARDFTSTRWRLAFLLIGLAALGLRVAALNRFSLGNDEIAEVRWSRLPWTEMLKAGGEDGAHPPLELLVQGAISRMGAADWVHRLPSVAAGVGTVLVAMILARRWFGDRASAVTGSILAFSPIHVRFSQEVRPYAIGLLLVLSSLLLLDLYRERRSGPFLLAWFLAVLAAGYTLYFGGLISALAGLLLILSDRRDALRTAWRLLAVFILGWFALYLPWFRYVLRTAGEKPPFSREALDVAWLSHRLQTLATGDWMVEPVSAGSWAFWLLVVAGIALAYRSKPARVCAGWLLLGLATQILFLQLRPHFPAVRHLLPSWLAAPFLAGFAVSQAGRIGRWAAAVLVGLVLLFDLPTLRAYYDHGRPRWDAVAAYLRDTHRPGHRVLWGNLWGLPEPRLLLARQGHGSARRAARAGLGRRPWPRPRDRRGMSARLPRRAGRAASRARVPGDQRLRDPPARRGQGPRRAAGRLRDGSLSRYGFTES